MPKKQASQDRKSRIAEMQQEQKRRENRVRLQIIAGCTVLLLVLAGVIAYAVRDAQSNQPEVAIEAIGVDVAAASCDPVTSDKAGGNGKHVPATADAKVKYDTVPPSNGPHFDQPAVSDRRFYTAKDRP